MGSDSNAADADNIASIPVSPRSSPLQSAVDISENLNQVHLDSPAANNDSGVQTSVQHTALRTEETVIVKVKAEFETQTIFFGLRRRQYASDSEAHTASASQTNNTLNPSANNNAHSDTNIQNHSSSSSAPGISSSSGAPITDDHIHGASEGAEREGKGKSEVVVGHVSTSTEDRPPSRQNASGALAGPFKTRSGRIVAKSSKRFVRSFGQFQQLHDYLLAKYPASFVPSLPTTPFPRLLTDPEHIDKKKRRVMVFLDRIQQPDLAFAQDGHVQAFLHPGVFAGATIHPRSPTLADEVSRAGSVLSSMFGSFSGSGAGDGVGEGYTGVSKYVPFMSAFKSMYASTTRKESVTDDDQDIQGGILDFDTLNAGVTHVLSDCNAVVASITESDTTRRETAVNYARLAQSISVWNAAVSQPD